ncbi:MAG TPA: hypothetical protein VK937_09555 [Candidatus Limnocylindria bacterium]|jgi:hypothetical protein|nr:hypothetical protein [Candidatus Limnocylindria bacterium]
MTFGRGSRANCGLHSSSAVGAPEVSPARKRVIARLLPPDPVAPAAFPDFLARQKKTFGKKRLKVSGAEQLAAERERF